MTETQIQKGKLLQNEAASKLILSIFSEHFLFNTINTIYGMALVDGDTLTAKALLDLADKLRLIKR